MHARISALLLALVLALTGLAAAQGDDGHHQWSSSRTRRTSRCPSATVTSHWTSRRQRPAVTDSGRTLQRCPLPHSPAVPTSDRSRAPAGFKDMCSSRTRRRRPPPSQDAPICRLDDAGIGALTETVEVSRRGPAGR